MPAGLDARIVSDGVDQGHVRRPLPVSKALDDVLAPREPGPHELLARADSTGLRQPVSVPFNDGGYQFWAVDRQPVAVV